MQTSFPKSQIKILLLENIHSAAVESFKIEGFHIESVASALSEGELIERIKDIHVLGIRSKTRITAKVLSEARRLVSIGCFCIGTDQVDLDAAKIRGVSVFNAPFSNTRSVAEMVIAEVIVLARRLGDRSMKMHQGVWEKSAVQCFEVRGKTLGIIGYGHIGSQVSVLAESLGLKVIFYDIVSKLPLGNSRSVSSLDQLLELSDFVTLHVPDTPQTRTLMGEAELRKMKKGSYLINASRGKVVDLDALAVALRQKHLEGAAIDVFPVEPEGNATDFKTVLHGLSNVILTPHLGGSTEEAQANIGVEVALSLTKYMNAGSSLGAVNFPQLDVSVVKDRHRILNVHRNVPGVLKSINAIISDLGANIEGQYLSTDPQIGYLIVDLDKALSVQVKDRIKALPESIRTRILY